MDESQLESLASAMGSDQFSLAGSNGGQKSFKGVLNMVAIDVKIGIFNMKIVSFRGGSGHECSFDVIVESEADLG